MSSKPDKSWDLTQMPSSPSMANVSIRPNFSEQTFIGIPNVTYKPADCVNLASPLKRNIKNSKMEQRQNTSTIHVVNQKTGIVRINISEKKN